MISAAFKQVGDKSLWIVAQILNETEGCLERISSSPEIFLHEAVKARLTNQEITAEGNSLRYASFALIREQRPS
jgi:hypothetical protein